MAKQGARLDDGPTAPPSPREEPVAADRSAVLALLAHYDVVLRVAAGLRVVEWLRVRSRRESWLGVLPLPRLTLGTSWLVRHHVLRSVEAMLRDHAAREALGALDASGRADQKALLAFRGAVSPVHWARVITGFAVAAFLLGRPVANAVTALVPAALDAADADGRVGPDSKDRVAALVGATRLAETVGDLSGGDTETQVAEFFDRTSLSDPASIVAALARADALVLVVVTLGVALSAYLVLRPFLQAFRLKRILLNLGAECPGSYRQTPSGWHVSHSGGVYAAERRAFGSTARPREIPFDLLLSLVATVLAVAFFAAILGFDDSDPTSRVILWTVVLPAAALRLGWLAGTVRARGGTEHADRSGPWLLPLTGGVVGRRPSASAGLTTAVSYGTASLALPLPWYRLVRQADRVRVEQQSLRPGRPTRDSRVLAALAAVGAWACPPAVLGWWLLRLGGSTSARWKLLLLVPGTAAYLAAWTLAGAGASEPGDDDPVLLSLSYVAYLAATGTCAATLQAWVNRHAAPLGDSPTCPPDGRAPSGWRFVPAPSWPRPPEDASIPRGWRPDPSWPPAPRGWRFWVPET